MSLTSATGIVVGNTVTYSIPGIGSSRGRGVIALVNYTKGASDAIVLRTYYRDTNISDDWFQQIVVDAYTLTKFEININFSGKFRIPLPTALNEEQVRLEFEGLIDGTVIVELNLDQGYH